MKKAFLGLATLMLATSASAGTVQKIEKVRVDVSGTNMTCTTHRDHTGYIPFEQDELVLEPQALKLDQKTLLKHPTLVSYALTGLCEKVNSIPVANGIATAKLEVTLRSQPDVDDPTKTLISEAVVLTFANGVKLKSSAMVLSKQD